MMRQFHNGMLARIQNDGEYSEPFSVTNGVKQGSVLALTLFSIGSPQCSHMLFRIVMMAFLSMQSDTTLMTRWLQAS